MESLELYAKDFMTSKEKLNTIGFELIGTKSNFNEKEIIYLVKKKK